MKSGSRDCAVLRALDHHHCGPGLIPEPGVICGLSLLLVLSLLREVFLRVLRFSPLLKKQHFSIPIQSGIRGLLSATHVKVDFSTQYNFVACDNLTTSLWHESFRVNQTYNLLTIVVHDTKNAVGFCNMFYWIPYGNRSHRQLDIVEIVYDFSMARAARALKIACDNRKLAFKTTSIYLLLFHLLSGGFTDNTREHFTNCSSFATHFGNIRAPVKASNNMYLFGFLEQSLS